MIPADDALRILDTLTAANIRAWVDGGWGVDALLGEQTRDHDDLDLVVELHAVDAIQAALAPLGFRLTEDERPTRCVLADDADRRIDLHTVVFDAEGGGIQTLQSGRAYRYPPEGFLGHGTIAGRPVPCLTPEIQLECHTGYDPDDKDRHDMELLCQRFGLAPPRAHRSQK